jgi:ribonuclease HI
MSLFDRYEDFQKYVCLASFCPEAPVVYADLTSNDWGPQSKQYLSIEVGRVYLLLGASEEPTWWYMVEQKNVANLLHLGGWAPPAYFRELQEYVMLHDVKLPPCTRVQASQMSHSIPYAGGYGSAGTCLIYHDGSTDASYGIAGGWTFCRFGGVAGKHAVDSASIACACNGSEASELLGIIGALHRAILLGSYFQEYVFCGDSQVALDHVFAQKDPVSKAGRDNWPAIKLARVLLQRLKDVSIVSVKKVTSKDNLAHCIAIRALRERSLVHWKNPDRLPHHLPPSYLGVVYDIARNRNSYARDCVFTLRLDAFKASTV